MIHRSFYLPSISPVALLEVTPHLQWPDRSGFSPDSFLSFVQKHQNSTILNYFTNRDYILIVKKYQFFKLILFFSLPQIKKG